MKSPRIIANIFLKNGIVVQSYKFKKYFPIGELSKSIEFLTKWGVDEIIIIEIENKKIDYVNLKKSLINCELPICYGGGVNILDNILKLLKIGVDKVSFNNLLMNSPNKIKKFSSYLGKQFIVGSIDLIFSKNNYFIFNHQRNKIDYTDTLKKFTFFEKLGVGEFFINFIDKDGDMSGLEIDYVKRIKSILNTPIIVTGGAANPQHLIDFYKKTSCTPAVGNMYNHFENPISLVKSCFIQKFGEVRTDNLYPYNKIFYEKILCRNEN